MRNLLVLLVVLAFGCGDDDRSAVDTGTSSDSSVDTSTGTDTGGGGGNVFIVDFDTTAGPFALEVHEDWAPLGVERFRTLVESGFYNDARFFRVIPGFVAQFGMAGDPAVQAMWDTPINDDPVVESNTVGTVTFAKTGAPNSRTTQLFINYGDNSRLDSMGFAVFGRIIEGVENTTMINSEYGEMPDQNQIRSRGNEYLEASFPNLDYIRTATIR